MFCLLNFGPILSMELYFLLPLSLSEFSVADVGERDHSTTFFLFFALTLGILSRRIGLRVAPEMRAWPILLISTLLSFVPFMLLGSFRVRVSALGSEPKAMSSDSVSSYPASGLLALCFMLCLLFYVYPWSRLSLKLTRRFDPSYFTSS